MKPIKKDHKTVKATSDGESSNIKYQSTRVVTPVLATLILYLLSLSFHTIVIAQEKKPNYGNVDEEKAPEVLKSVRSSLEPHSKIVAKLQVQDDLVYFVERETGDVSMIATGPQAARALSVLKRVRKYSNLEIFEALGGRRENTPPVFLLEHQAKYGGQLKHRKYPSIADILSSDDVLYGGTDCNPDENPCGPDGGKVEAGLLATALNICEEEYDFDTWENYLGNYSFHPWISNNISGPLEVLGTNGQFGKGEWTNGNANITIPPTKAGGIVVCSRNFTGDGPTIIVQEELFPGAWFHHFQQDYIYSGMVYGIVVDGPVTRHPIRVLIRNFEAEDEFVGSDNIFWWGAAY